MVFPVAMYGYESWNIKKKKLSAKELMLLNYAGKDSLRVPWTATSQS